ncbi:hypothetical protein SCHPADRAFT_947826 [Schizopora paradoxa]|uniref:Uncharacterized protein n=1 Tax=Schizopora paradoxa TaxID=27342 RepID=A0A0H2QZ80_9AGAM|nr:hypothetical protein SCHPADRAFT_947826 [Schizopora paradoxa]
MNQLELPHLLELRIAYPEPPYTQNLQKVPFLTSSKPLPKLHSVALQNCMPSNTATSFSVIKSLEMWFFDIWLFMEPPRLLNFIRSFTSLGELALKIGCKSEWIGNHESLHHVRLETLCIFRLTVFRDVFPERISSVVENLSFPNCAEVELHFVGLSESDDISDVESAFSDEFDSDGEGHGVLDFTGHIRAVFGCESPTADISSLFPKAERLCLHISVLPKFEDLFTGAVIELPLKKVPFLRSFTLRSDLELGFETNVDVYPHGSFFKYRGSPTPTLFK